MKILAIGAHLDDIELSCGGFISMSAKKGHEIYFLITTNSAYRSYNGKVYRTIKQARSEAKSAIKKMGFNNLLILNNPTKKLQFNDKLVEQINKFLDKHNPDLILTQWVYDGHQDHRNTALATIAAGRYHKNILMYEPIPPSSQVVEVYKPQLYVNITDHIDKKIAAIKEHKSQYHKYGPVWVDDIFARARFRGMEIGYKYAESFQIIKLDAEKLGLL